MGGLDHQSLVALKLSEVACMVFQSKGPVAFLRFAREFT